MVRARRALILGGARSGKSREAQCLAAQSGHAVVVIATAEAGDGEMAARIERHRTDRPITWRTVEVPLDLVEALEAMSTSDSLIVVDCLTLWLANLMAAGRDPAREAERLAAFTFDSPHRFIFVSNETGLGIVPATPLGRAFRDEQGRLNQRLAEVCDAVVFMVSGQPILLKPRPERERLMVG